MWIRRTQFEAEKDAARAAGAADAAAPAAAAELARDSAELVSRAIVGEAAAAKKKQVDGPDIGTLVTATTGAVTALLALLSGIGLSGETLAVVFNGGPGKEFLIGSLVLAAVAVGLGLLTVVLKGRGAWAIGVAVAAVIALVASLWCSVQAASSTYSSGGRPNVSKVAVTLDGSSRAVVTFTVTATGVTYSSLLRAQVGWREPGLARPYISTLRPDNKGVVNQEVTVPLDRRATDQIIRILVYYDRTASEATATAAPSAAGDSSDKSTDAESPAPPTRPAPSGEVRDICTDQADARVSAACVEVLVVALASPSPTPSPS